MGNPKSPKPDPSTPPAPPTLWDRSRQVAVAAILDTALKLFAERGYERTTIAQIAQEAGISQRSLFRYFGTKEDLVCGDQEALGELLKNTVDAQPADASPWDALRAGFEAVLVANHTPDRVLQISTLILNTPSLRARAIEKRLRWQAALVPGIETRMGIPHGPVPDPRALAVITTAFACLDTATELWVRTAGTTDITQTYDQALTTVRTTP
ncbi:TetR/AcrR family transcriptional regulator [Streptomyces sp. NBC_00582]|uniref:TetR/AcrR family transcriptional regulator n=1 Tax=Streptomyces sp. NBC_00582 TaxID=2975783 RepID=UPI001063CE33|nr:TetR/AcrR family transcriptional regulator [Streptomyces sp. NBC_00582]WUB63786.1 TetR/AcrR family transcriptional regulator [Streptomyces sp. NBC_00582]